MKLIALSATLLALTACSNDNNNDSLAGTDDNTTPAVEKTGYRVTLVNLTDAQPLSPPAVILHEKGYSAWTTGMAASSEMEILAEGGDGSDLLKSQSGNPTFSGSGELTPGASLSLEISNSDTSKDHLTVASMLVNTNDAFTGLTNLDLSGMQKGDKRMFLTPAYDAGTEFNDELKAHVPGPAGGGEGFNKARDDVTTVVTYHGGVVSKDDGYAESTLSEAHRFDNPVMRITISRL